MGAGIAEVTCTKGKHVLIKDMKKENAYKAVAGIETSLSKKVKRKRMTQHQFNLASANLTPLYEDLGSWERHMRQANIIVEAVFENLEVKQNLIRSIEPVFEGVTDFPIFATNTSALPIRDIAQASTHPDKVVGLHYFSPVPMMPLVEIIPHEGTSQETLNRVLALAVAQGKTPILVKDVPGFYVNRCLAPMMMETQAVVREGHDIQTIDKLMVQHGLPVGPLTLGDEVGLDVAFSMATFMKEKGGLGVRMDGDISLMQQMVEQMDSKGRKTGKGFYLYEDESKSKKSKKSKTKTLNPEVQAVLRSQTPSSPSTNQADIQDRILGKFVNEAIHCLQDEIVSSPLQGDVGAVFGVGFPPFKGGPFRMIDEIGSRTYCDRLLALRDQYGEQFEPAPLLQDMAKENKKFHS
jgi:enoyl-CoA hydratase/long-chain 3-hydroxyacyl-CoA dehydrogenase